jgi:hypothetical protein
MDINLTGQFLGMPFSLTGAANQSVLYAILGAIAGALLTGLLNIVRDLLSERRNKTDKKNRLISQLIGQKSLTLQNYGFYFFSFIAHEYLNCRSTIQGIHGINYEKIASIPVEVRSKEAMEMANDAREGSVEYKSALRNEERLHKSGLDLAKSNKQLLEIIGSLRTYYINDKTLGELIEQIEIAIDQYSRLEKTIKNEFNEIGQYVTKTAGNILQEALSSKINPNKIRDNHFYVWINKADEAERDVKDKREAESKNLEEKIDALIAHVRKQKTHKVAIIGIIKNKLKV